jgi:PhzF family phenazine biosynthesis protein
MQRVYSEVDVFTAVPYRGNPLAVVLDADGLTTEAMQQFANWTNFSETSFVLRPEGATADYRVRIFTPTTELPFAGHPTIGTCHAWLAHGGVPKEPDLVVQECGVGPIAIRRTGGNRLAFAAPPILRGGRPDDATMDNLVDALGITSGVIVDSAWIDNGPGWLGVLLDSAEAVLALEIPDTDLKIGVIGAYPRGSSAAYEVRAFFPSGGRTIEDPVTGSLNASAAQWLIGSGRVTPPFVASQGAALGRSGVVHISTDEGGQVWVGGDVVTCVDGVVEL